MAGSGKFLDCIYKSCMGLLREGLGLRVVGKTCSRRRITYTLCTLALTLLQVQSTTLPSTTRGGCSSLCAEHSGRQSDTTDQVTYKEGSALLPFALWTMQTRFTTLLRVFVVIIRHHHHHHHLYHRSVRNLAGLVYYR